MADNNFSEKVVLVTGGSSGIGLATATAFAGAGAQVVISGRNQHALEQAVAIIGHDAVGLKSDAGRIADISTLIETLRNRFGRIDVIFANAGVGTFLSIDEATEADWDECHTINLKGPYFLVQRALPLLGRGSVIIINGSIGASYVGHGSGIYSASKAGLRSIARSLAVELAPRGIRVNMMSPGPTDTPLPYRTKGITHPEQFKAAITTTTALGRQARPEEIAAAVLFLASDESSFVLGTELVVDGGFLALR